MPEAFDPETFPVRCEMCVQGTFRACGLAAVAAMDFTYVGCTCPKDWVRICDVHRRQWPVGRVNYCPVRCQRCGNAVDYEVREHRDLNESDLPDPDVEVIPHPARGVST